jgi:hypothetical protein
MALASAHKLRRRQNWNVSIALPQSIHRIPLRINSIVSHFLPRPSYHLPVACMHPDMLISSSSLFKGLQLGRRILQSSIEVGRLGSYCYASRKSIISPHDHSRANGFDNTGNSDWASRISRGQNRIEYVVLIGRDELWGNGYLLSEHGGDVRPL